MAFIPLTIDAARLCDGLSRAGYAPSHSIISLIENAVTAGAKKITAVIVPMSEEHRNVREYLVIDDGNGMDRAGIKPSTPAPPVWSQRRCGARASWPSFSQP